MSKPWDRPAIPRQGDTDEEFTYAYAGRVLTQWESVEFELSRLYAWFGGKLDNTELMREYGSGRIFPERADKLRNISNSTAIKITKASSRTSSLRP